MGEQRLSEEQIAELKQVTPYSSYIPIFPHIPPIFPYFHIPPIFLLYSSHLCLQLVSPSPFPHLVSDEICPGFQWVWRWRRRKHQHERAGLGDEGHGDEPHWERLARAHQWGPNSKSHSCLYSSCPLFISPYIISPYKSTRSLKDKITLAPSSLWW